MPIPRRPKAVKEPTDADVTFPARPTRVDDSGGSLAEKVILGKKRPLPANYRGSKDVNIGDSTASEQLDTSREELNDTMEEGKCSSLVGCRTAPPLFKEIRRDKI